MSHSARKPTLWHLRIDPDQPAQSAQTDLGQYIPSQRDRGKEYINGPETENQQETKSVYPGQPAGMLRLIRVDT